MVQRSKQARFTLKPRNTIGIARESFRKKFDSNTTAQLRVGGSIYVTHAAAAEMPRDLVMCELRSDHDLPNTSMPRGMLPEPPQITQEFEDGRRRNHRTTVQLTFNK